MTPVSLNEFLIRHPAILRLRLQVDEAAVELKHAHVASLRALADKNTPLISAGANTSANVIVVI